ncbi:MAG TPA: prolyl oligopeptidase family serine peptidase [Candidatus Limnocylindria bacterium]|nr:prolyl oligopeptidase family serine peptidase [Candidatus Limnocylindria bacterium]
MPSTPRDDIIDTLHGERIADPYRWLEDDASPRVRDWTDAQNARTRAVLDALPQRAVFARRLRELLSVGLLSTPRPVAGKIFHTRRQGEQRQAVLYVRDAIDSPDRALVDPNAIDPSGLVTLDWYYPSHDARYVAYGLSHGGDELSTLRVIETATGTDLGDRIPHTQRSTVAWVHAGFYYTVHPAPGSVPPGDENYFRRVRFHRLGDDPSKDVLVFGEGRPKEDILLAATSPNGRWVLFTAMKGWARSDLYVMDREHPGRGLLIAMEAQDAIAEGAPYDDGRLWLRTNLDAPNYRIVDVSCEDPGASRWRTVIPEGEDAIQGFDRTRDRLAVLRLERATSRLATYDLVGGGGREIALPSLGTIEFVQAEAAGDRIGYTFQSFTQPPVAFVADARTGEAGEFVRLRTPEGHDPSRIAVEQTTYGSRDGTEISMFLVHRTDVKPNGDVPTLLTGYGGFNVSRTPAYFPGAAAWVERGGLFALPNLRGGGEYGERWHRAGMLANKQNVFDDFHAAAEALVSRGWTSPARLAVSGGSNGGLLVGAALTQRPELFTAVCCAVPLLDMLRYQNFRIARFWIAEYGSAEGPDQIGWLRGYSPYHNVRAGVRYPPVLFTTAEGDSRVDPMHARKMAALLQAQTEDPGSIVLLRVDRDAGHGIGKPLDKQVDDLADQYAFIAWRTRLEMDGTAMLGRG